VGKPVSFRLFPVPAADGSHPTDPDRPAGVASGPGRPARGSGWRPSRVRDRAGIRILRGPHLNTGPVITVSGTSTARPVRPASPRPAVGSPGRPAVKRGAGR